MSSHDKYDDENIDEEDDDDDDDDDDDEVLLLRCYVQISKTKIHENNLEYCSLRFHLIGDMK